MRGNTFFLRKEIKSIIQKSYPVINVENWRVKKVTLTVMTRKFNTTQVTQTETTRNIYCYTFEKKLL